MMLRVLLTTLEYILPIESLKKYAIQLTRLDDFHDVKAALDRKAYDFVFLTDNFTEGELDTILQQITQRGVKFIAFSRNPTLNFSRAMSQNGCMGCLIYPCSNYEFEDFFETLLTVSEQAEPDITMNFLHELDLTHFLSEASCSNVVFNHPNGFAELAPMLRRGRRLTPYLIRFCPQKPFWFSKSDELIDNIIQISERIQIIMEAVVDILFYQHPTRGFSVQSAPMTFLFFALNGPDEESNGFTNLYEDLKRRLSEFHLDVSCVIGMPFSKEPFHVQIIKLLSCGEISYCDGVFYSYHRLSDHSISNPPLPLEQLRELLETGDSYSFLNCLREHLYSEKLRSRMSQKLLYDYFRQIDTLLREIWGQFKISAAFDSIYPRRIPMEHEMSVPLLLELAEYMVTQTQQFLQYPKARCQLIISDVQRYIEDHFQEEITRESIAKYFYFSPDYLGRSFKRETEMSISEYLLNVRVEHAQRLLLNQVLTMDQIASAVGFQSLSYFSSAFKRINGISPLKYRKRLLAEGKTTRGRDG